VRVRRYWKSGEDVDYVRNDDGHDGDGAVYVLDPWILKKTVCGPIAKDQFSLAYFCVNGS